MTHLPYIVAAYLASGLVLAGMVLWTAVDLRTQRRKLGRLDATRTERRTP